MTRARATAAVSLLATLTAFALSSSNGIASRDPVSVSALAPADEYFGRQKLSPLGIRHEVLSLKDDLHHAREHPDAIEHKAELVEDAVDDWAERYPNDTWIASAAWQLGTLFEELPGKDAHEHAIVVLELVRDKFAASAFAANAKRDLDRGIGIRPWPRWAGPEPGVQLARAMPAPASSPAAAHSPARPSQTPATRPSQPPATVTDAKSLVDAIRGVNPTPDPGHVAAIQDLESRFWSLSRNGTDAAYTRAAWELAAVFERLPGQDSKAQAIRLLALLVDRYPDQIFGRWAMRDLARGIGDRN